MALTRLPGLIDVHTHLREPGATCKEDFFTGSRAALAGGFTFILDMPNNPAPTLTLQRLEEKLELAKKGVCEIGFYFGSNGRNLGEFAAAWRQPKVFGLKLYLSPTTEQMDLSAPKIISKIFRAWQSEKPILVHAEGQQLDLALGLAKKIQRRLHVCHVPDARSVELIKIAKKQSQGLSAGVTPHHLFLSVADAKKLGPLALMKPSLKSKQDQSALWQALLDGTIDLIESDHAPHTIAEKWSANPPIGVPGLETTLGLLGKAMREGLVSLEQTVRWLHDNPKKLFNLPDQPQTYVEADFERPFKIEPAKLQTKCKWSPFVDFELYGRVQNAAVRGKLVLKDFEWV